MCPSWHQIPATPLSVHVGYRCFRFSPKMENLKMEYEHPVSIFSTKM